MKRFPAPALIALLTLTSLAGCGADPANPPPIFCPQVAVLQQASSLTQFLPGPADMADEITQAQITGVAGACTLKAKKQRLQVSFRVGFAASNGPANHSATLNLPYFVAITQGNNIISEQNYNIDLSFAGNLATTQATTRSFTLDFPNQSSSRDLQILIGFQLTPAQLSYAAAHPLAAP